MKRVLVPLVAAVLSLSGPVLADVARADDPTLPPVPAISGAPIVSLPTDALVPSYVGSPATARPIAHPAVPRNPWLAGNGRSSMHDDAYSSDAYDVAGPLGRDLQVSTASYGIRECATVTFDRRGRLVGLCGGLEGFSMMLIDPVSLQPLAELAMPGRKITGITGAFTDLCGGTYFFLTQHDKAITLTNTNEVWQVAIHDGPTLVKERGWALGSHIPSGDCIVALTADWNGRVWFFTKQGTIGTLDRATGRVRTLRLRAGEGIFNSVSSDETGGVYAVSTHALYRFDATSTGTPRVTWRAAYDRGTTQKPGQLSQGSGTSPTLLGKRFISITDNAEPRMHVLVYDRRRGVAHRRFCSVPVFGPGASDTENSLVAAGRSMIVENNYGYDGPQSTMGGASTTPGLARVLIGRSGCRVAWTSHAIAPTSVAKASLGNGLLYAYTKPARSDGIDAWYFSAIDIRTGSAVWSRLTGTGTQWNNHYAAIYLGPDGTAYIATLTGLVRLRDG